MAWHIFLAADAGGHKSGPAEFQILVMEPSAHGLAHFFSENAKYTGTLVWHIFWPQQNEGAQKWSGTKSNTSNEL